MRVIIAGSRSMLGTDIIAEAVLRSGFHITEVVEGEAPGVDRLARRWAETNGIAVKPMPANWNDVTHSDAVIRYRYGRPYDVRAGFRRNAEMADYADALIAIWEDESNGTENMLEQMWTRKKPFYLLISKPSEPAFTINELMWMQRSDESRGA